MDDVALNRVFHDHECGYYDARFGIVHDEVSAHAAVTEVEQLLGSRLRDGDVRMVRRRTDSTAPGRAGDRSGPVSGHAREGGFRRGHRAGPR